MRIKCSKREIIIRRFIISTFNKENHYVQKIVLSGFFYFGVCPEY